MNDMTLRQAALAAAALLALLCGCTPAEKAAAPADVSASADTAPADTAVDTTADTASDTAPDTAIDSPVDAALDTSAEIALPQCASASDCPAPGLCWLATCTSKGTCALAPTATGSPCDDGNACTTGDQCGSGLCVGTAKLACDDDNACTEDQCSPVTGCLKLPVAASSVCDDGDPCTQGDTCLQGQCKSGQSVCQCKTNSDCAKFDDGDLCNGTLYCDKAGGSAYTCKVNPASVVICATASDSACQTNTCAPSTGECKLVVAPANTPCSDGEVCTTGDFCSAGQCQGGTNTCLCKNDADCQGKEDGNLCNGSLFCNKATAQCQVNPVSVVTCQTVDDTDCLKNVCHPKEGKCHLQPLKDGKVCEDGNPCTPNEACSAGECFSAINTCECQKDADCLAKDDGNLCNGTLYCDGATNHCRVNPATVVSCTTDDDPVCLADVCNPKTGNCSEIALPKDGTACDDGNSCTAQSLCQGGQCQSGANLCECQTDGDCSTKEDGNLCNGKLFCNPKSNKCEVNPATVVACAATFDEECLTNQCDPNTGACSKKPAHQGNQCGGKTVCSAGGWCNAGLCEVEGATGCECQKDSECAKLEDGDFCNGTLYCNKTLPKPLCQLNPATVVVCQIVANTACSQAQCQPASGTCKMVALTGACSDGLACTEQDGCSQGTCKGSAKECIDSLPCTADSCAEPFGCLNLPTSVSPCDDGNACTAADACLGGKCIGTAKSCEDGNPCTSDSCNGEKGCQFNVNSSVCSDGNPCTQLDLCKDGACIPGVLVSCDDGNLCTADSCNPATGKCNYAVGGPSASCADSNACTDDICDPKLGCTYVPNQANCEDGNPCTSDACDAASGCAHLPASATCSDSNACTANDACSQGKCAGSTISCDDANVCTSDACDAAKGCLHSNLTSSCDDGSVCSTKDACVDGSCKGITFVTCADANACTDDSCDPKAGCTFVANTLPCSDGVECTVGDACKSTACVAGPLAAVDATVGGVNGDYLYDVHVQGDGSVVAIGYTASLGAGAADAWWIHTTADGKLIKQVTYGGAGSDTAYQLLPMANGEGIVIGDTDSKGFGKQDAWLLHIDKDGKQLHDRFWGTAADDVVGHGALLQNGGIVAVGRSGTSPDPFIMWTSLDGAGFVKPTHKVFTSAAVDRFRGVIELSDGKLALCGSRDKSVLFMVTDAAGGVLVEKTYPLSAFSYGAESLGTMLRLSGGDFVIFGAQGTSGNATDAYVLRVKVDGTQVWLKKFDAFSSWDSYQNGTVSADDHLYLTRYSDAASNARRSGIDVIDANGLLTARYNYAANTSYNQLYGLELMADGTMWAVGYYPVSSV